MGMSAVKAAYDTAASHLVEPKQDASGYTQPAYVRGGRSAQTSKKLKWHQGCIATKMAGKTFTDRGAVQEEFKKVSGQCKVENPR